MCGRKLNFVMPKQAKKKSVSTKKAAKNVKAKVTAAPKTKGRGTRYTPAEKAKVLAYVDQVNAEQGRGGAAAASRKFGISQISIGQWVKKSGVPVSAKRGVVARKSQGGDFSEKLRRLADVHEAIAAKQSELIALEREYVQLKKSL